MSDAQTLALIEALGRRVQNLEILESVQNNDDLDFAIPSVTLGLANAIGTLDTLLRSDATLISRHLGIGVGVAPTADRIHTYRDDASLTPTLFIEQDGDGDAALQFRLTALQDWSLGIDNSDGDKFKIVASSLLATLPIVTIQTDVRMGLGTTEPGDNVAQGAADFAGVLFHVKSTAARAHLVAEGHFGGFLDLIDYSGAANTKILQAEMDAGLLVFRALNDDLTVRNDNILVLDHATGFVGLNTSSPDVRLQNVGATKLGDDNTNFVLVGTTGDVNFVGGAGLIFGSMYIPGVDIVVAIGGVNPVEVRNGTSDGWTAGELHNVTFPTGGLEHFLTITEPGRYEILWNMSFHSDTGGAQGCHGGVAIDSVAIRDNGEAHRTVTSANDSGNISAPCILDLPNGTEQISLWISNSASNDMHVEHATVTVKQIGGT